MFSPAARLNSSASAAAVAGGCGGANSVDSSNWLKVDMVSLRIKYCVLRKAS
jgi:hypothetical protein